ncbi:putative RNA uridine N3 methyltransferase [Thermoproteota archaeon]
MKKQKLWVALPDSLLSDTLSLRDKTIKIGIIARICSIFRVNKLFFYHDKTSTFHDFELMKIILEYLDTPQYLRKHLFSKRNELQYAGLLSPLRTPHHKLVEKLSEIKVGDFREGIVIKKGGNYYADVGLSKLVLVDGRISEGSRISVKFTSAFPNLRCKIIERDDVNLYWGYEVKEAGSLKNLIKSINADLCIITSRKGIPIKNIWQTFISDTQKALSIIVVFGSPKSSVQNILLNDNVNPEDISRYILNILPNQGTATIRTEEALLGTLSILNFVKSLSS